MSDSDNDSCCGKRANRFYGAKRYKADPPAEEEEGTLPPKPKYLPDHVDWKSVCEDPSCFKFFSDFYSKTEAEREHQNKEEGKAKDARVVASTDWKAFLVPKPNGYIKAELAAYCRHFGILQKGTIEEMHARVLAHVNGAPLEGSIRKKAVKPEVDLSKIDFAKHAAEGTLVKLKMNELQAYCKQHLLPTVGPKDTLVVRVRVHARYHDARVITADDINIAEFIPRKVDWTDRKYVVALLAAEDRMVEESNQSFISWKDSMLELLKGDLEDVKAMIGDDGEDKDGFSCKYCNEPASMFGR